MPASYSLLAEEPCHGCWLLITSLIVLPLSFSDSLVAQVVKSLPAMQKTQVQSLNREDPLEKEIATHSSIPAWRSPWMEEPGGLLSTGSQRVRQLSS